MLSFLGVWNRFSACAENGSFRDEELRIMKKRVLLICLAALFALSLAGCKEEVIKGRNENFGEGPKDIYIYRDLSIQDVMIDDFRAVGGIILLSVMFAIGFVLTNIFKSINIIMYISFALVGVAWAAINVNSLPMVVEMCKGSDIGKFTGYYYTASMAAQIVTPILAGTLMRLISYKILFGIDHRAAELRHHDTGEARRPEGRDQEGSGSLRRYA